MLTQPRVEGTVPVGRRQLGFAEFGPADGRPVVWLHGTPGARRQIPQAARVAADELNLRIIGLDRPGVGASTPHLYDDILAFTDDLRLVVDALGIRQFGLIGLSGGGPYALACAYAMPERVMALAILGGVAPSIGPDAAEGGVVALAARFQSLLTSLRVPLALGLATAIWALRPFTTPALHAYARISPEGDRELLLRPEFRAMFIDDILRGSRPGLKAPIYDAVLFGRPWGFSVRDVNVPVRWWHGDADHIVPLRHGQHVVGLLPDATLAVRPGESHLGGLALAEEVLGAVLAAWDERVGATAAARG